ncbi:MAG: hypothetical protein A2W35_13415 [Chloroflexi bacterium RBG_16_57_11]|nr:MAG: hypothetical protein A2W35_13415 [Chloroflexi bacterium RBG_16_57_11]
MSKKFLVPFTIALLLALTAGVWGYSDVAAQAGIPRPRPRRLPGVLGQVTAIEADQFTIQTRAGQERTFRFDETTRFTNPDRQDLSAEDLQTGGWVAVAVVRSGSAPRLARLVIILPEDFDPENWAGVRGKLTGVDVPGNSFTLENKDGQPITVKVDASTKYRGQVTGLAELQVGMLAQAVTEKQPNGDLLAIAVRAGFPADRRFLGKVTAVDADSFTIQTRQAEALTFRVTSETRFLSRRSLVGSLEELKAGMAVAVGAKDLGNGQYQALRVLVAPRLMK